MEPEMKTQTPFYIIILNFRSLNNALFFVYSWIENSNSPYVGNGQYSSQE